jgi:hypothetical protein
MHILRFLLASLICVVLSAKAQLALEFTGTGTNTFNALPALASGWSTLAVAPSSTVAITTAEQLDAAVQTNTAALITNALGSTVSSVFSGGSSSAAKWNSVNLNLQTRASGNSYTLLMSTLRNDTGFDLSGAQVRYDFGALVSSDAYIEEDVPGFRAYYSLSGAANSWTLIPGFSTNGNPENPVTLTANLEFSTGWSAGSRLYVLWADDNAAVSGDTSYSGHEGCYTIDNFSTLPVVEDLKARVTPQSLNVAECGAAAFAAQAMGGTQPYTYQWYFNLHILDNETNAALTLPHVQLSGAGLYNVVVQDSSSGGPEMATGSVSLAVTPSTPALLGAIGLQDLHTILATLSKPIQISSAGGADFGVHAANDAEQLTVVSAVVSNGTTVVLKTVEAREAKNYKVIVQSSGIHDACGNTVAAGSETPLASDLLLIGLADNSSWRYRDDGVDPGSDWMQPGIDLDAWATGAAAFDGTPDEIRLCLLHDETVEIPVRTHLQLTSTNYQEGAADIPTYYFRTQFNFHGDSAHSSLSLKTLIDDGCVVYINGQEAWRQRVTNDPSGQLSFDLYCQPRPGSNMVMEGPFNLPLTNLVFGENTLAVCLKQSRATNADITMALSLTATITNFLIAPLQVSAAMTPANGIVNQDGAVSFQVSASGGIEPYHYQWFKNDTNWAISGATGSTMTLSSVQPADAGNYFVVVTDSALGGSGRTNSPLFTLQVLPNATAQPLTVALVDGELEVSWPFNGMVFQLQSTPGLGQGWSSVSEPDDPSGGYHRVRVAIQSGNRYFRLFKP